YAAHHWPAVIRGVRHLPRAWIAAVYLIGFSCVLARNSDFVQSVPLLVLLRRVTLASFYAFIIAEQNWADHSLLKVGRLKWCSYWGKLTYGLYLLHPIAVTLATLIFGLPLGVLEAEGHPGSIASLYAAGALALALSLLISYASYHFLEMPF